MPGLAASAPAAPGPTVAVPDLLREEPVAPVRPGNHARWWLVGWMVALAARALWVTLVLEPSRAVYSDMGGYFQRSGQVLETGRWDPFLFFQGAGYPLVLGAVRKLWAHDADFGLVTAWLQIAASLGALAVSVQLARLLAGRRGAGMVLALGALHVPWLYFNSVYMAEAMYTALLAAVGLALVAVARDPDARWRWTLLAGLLAGVAAWFKSAHLLVGPVAAVLWLFPLRRRWQGSARIFAGWFAGLALALWIPHGALSYTKSGRFMASPPAGGLNFVEGKCPSKENKDAYGYGYWSPLFVQKGIRNTKHWPRPFLDQGYFYGEGFKCILERPMVLLESFEAIPELFVGNELWPANDCGPRARQLSNAWARVFEWPLVAGVVLAFLLAVARSWRPRPADERTAILWLALAAPALSLFAVVWIMKSELRFRVPFDVFFFPLALWGWTELLAWCWRRAFPRIGASITLGDTVPGGPGAPEPLGAMPRDSTGSAERALICLPTYNERENLEPIIAAIHASVADVDVLVIDDGSPDGTGDVADELAARDPRVNVLHRAAKQGLGKAYLAGFDWALARGYDLVLEMDADFSHDPKYLPVLVERARRADLVLGSRYVPGGGTVNWGLARKLISRGGSVYARSILGVGVRDLTGGFKCFRRGVLEAIDLPSVECTGYAFQIELTYRALCKGFRVAEVPIVFADRRVGKSKMSRRIVFEAMRKVWGMRFSRFAREALARPRTPPDRAGAVGGAAAP